MFAVRQTLSESTGYLIPHSPAPRTPGGTGPPAISAGIAQNQSKLSY